MGKNYIDYIDKGHREAEKRIDKNINSHLNFLRNDVIRQKWLDKDDMDMYINSLLSDPICKQEITEGYQMIDKEHEEIVIEAENRLKPSFWLNKKKGSPEEIEKIENIRKRFLGQKSKNSYKKSKKYINKPEYEESYKSKIKKFDTRDITLNNVLEFAIRDLLEDILQDLKGSKEFKGLQDFKIIKTNEYDDVCSKTDFILELEYPEVKRYGSFDLTVSNNKENLERKAYPKKVFCPNFHFKEGIKYAIPRSLIVLEDKEFVFKYLKKYMQQIQMTGSIEPNNSLKLLEIIGYNSIEIKKNILEQLITNISKN